MTTVGTAGTPVYMAPEQHEGGSVDARADQFAWCATMYQGLAGVEPFAARSRAELLEAKRLGRLATPRRRVPPRIMRVLRRGLRADPEDRFESLEHPMQAIARAVVPRYKTTPARVGAAATAVLAWWLWPASEETDACPTEHLLLQEHWSDDHRASIPPVLSERSPRFGNRAWSWIEPRVTTQVTHWAVLERRSCESLLQGSETPRADPRSVCLRRWAATLDGAVQSLAAGEFDSARDAIGIVEQIPDPAVCGRQSVTGSSPLLSGADTTHERDRIMAYLQQLDRARVLRRDSYLEEVVEQLQSQVRVAADNGWVAALAESYTDLGTALMAMDRLDEAVENLREGVASAVKSGHLYIEANARIALVQTLGERQARFELAELERRYAEATVERLGDPVLRAEYELVVGGVAWRQGDSERASEHISRAVQLFEEQPSTSALRHATASAYLGSVLRRIEPARAEAMITSALAIYDRELDELHPIRINTLTDLAESVSSQGRSAEALEIMQDVVGRIERQEPARRRPVSLVVARFRLATLLGAQGDNKAAVAQLQAAYAIAHEHLGDEHPSTLSVQMMLGAFANEIAVHEDDAEPWLKTAERHLVPVSAGLDRTLGPSHPDSLLARLYLGKLRATRGQEAEARALLEACIAYRTEQDNPSPVVPDVAVQARLALAKLIWTDEPTRAEFLARQAWTGLDAIGDPEIREARHAELSALLCTHGTAAPGLRCSNPGDEPGP